MKRQVFMSLFISAHLASMQGGQSFDLSKRLRLSQITISMAMQAGKQAALDALGLGAAQRQCKH